MSSEQLLSNIIPFAGSGLLGYVLPGPGQQDVNKYAKKTAVAMIIGMTYFYNLSLKGGKDRTK